MFQKTDKNIWKKQLNSGYLIRLCIGSMILDESVITFLKFLNIIELQSEPPPQFGVTITDPERFDTIPSSTPRSTASSIWSVGRWAQYLRNRLNCWSHLDAYPKRYTYPTSTVVTLSPFYQLQITSFPPPPKKKNIGQCPINNLRLFSKKVKQNGQIRFWSSVLGPVLGEFSYVFVKFRDEFWMKSQVGSHDPLGNPVSKIGLLFPSTKHGVWKPFIDMRKSQMIWLQFGATMIVCWSWIGLSSITIINIIIIIIIIINIIIIIINIIIIIITRHHHHSSWIKTYPAKHIINIYKQKLLLEPTSRHPHITFHWAFERVSFQGFQAVCTTLM